ncbi:proline-rich protein 7-like [Conger conger]|uniref:proline-rich protein 7-like n=1 Tax=Conger conger TaxID=82655 RepID=UPI002A5B02C4|nr:proline-rich protein 7-like [Conger conger]
MVMSQGTYTFLTCFAGFWLVWALVVLLCCFCNSLQRRLKRQRERRLRQHILDTPPAGEPPHGTAPPPAQQGSWTAAPDLSGKPPSYEDAVLMEDPPPPYSAILGDARGGTCPDPEGRTPREPESSETSKPAPDSKLSKRAGRGYSSVIHLPTAVHCESRGPLLSTLELNCNNLPNRGLAPGTMSNPVLAPGTTPTDLRLGPPLLDRTYALPTAFPVFGRSTAV